MITERIKEDEIKLELVRLGMNDRLASDLAFRYYNNEITLKDLEFLKLELNSKIDFVRTELKKDIEILDTKLSAKFLLHNWMLGFILAFQVAIFYKLFF